VWGLSEIGAQTKKIENESCVADEAQEKKAEWVPITEIPNSPPSGL
jgi:hypothetical protein